MSLLTVNYSTDEILIMADAQGVDKMGKTWPAPKVFPMLGTGLVVAGAGDMALPFGLYIGIGATLAQGATYDVIAASAPEMLRKAWKDLGAAGAQRDENSVVVLAGYCARRGRMAAHVFGRGKNQVGSREFDGVEMGGDFEVMQTPGFPIDHMTSSFADLTALARVQREMAKRDGLAPANFPCGGPLSLVSASPAGLTVRTVPESEWTDEPADPLRAVRQITGFRFPAVTLPA